MARNPKDAFPSGMIFGIPNSHKYTPYHDLNEVLNIIGVMAKRTEIPFARITHLPKKSNTAMNNCVGLHMSYPKIGGIVFMKI